MKGLPRGFDYLRRSYGLFMPKTQATALRAVEQGILPEEAFIYKGVNVRPIFEEPYDFMEIERFLARQDLDLGTALLLMRIFEVLIKDSDKEKALFAAESMNALEVRYANRIQNLRKKVSEEFQPETLRALVNALYELGTLSYARPVLKRFYLMEARQYLRRYWKKLKPKIKDLKMYVDILLDLGLAERAEKLVNRYLAKKRQNPELLYIHARIKFVQHDYLTVMTGLAFLYYRNLLPKAKTTHEFWMGDQGHV